MFLQALQNHFPTSWSYTDIDDYRQVLLARDDPIYHRLHACMHGVNCSSIKKITQVENPYLYGQFLLKKAEYENRGNVEVVELFHSTGAYKVDSILRNNLDWRAAHRVRFGVGVSFSPHTEYADRVASWSCGTDRAMIVADVLVGNAEEVFFSPFLPGIGFDTTVGNRGNVYVKFYDDECYPKHVIYYENQSVKRRRVENDHIMPDHCSLS